MGYKIQITRADHPISEAEWRAVADNDPELLYSTADRCWLYITHSDLDPLRFKDGAARATNPRQTTVGKMFELAGKLGARVIGQEGEIYGADGTSPRGGPPAKPVPWWKNLFRWRAN